MSKQKPTAPPSPKKPLERLPNIPEEDDDKEQQPGKPPASVGRKTNLPKDAKPQASRKRVSGMGSSFGDAGPGAWHPGGKIESW